MQTNEHKYMRKYTYISCARTHPVKRGINRAEESIDDSDREREVRVNAIK